MPPRKRLGQLLTELGVIDEHQLQSALGHQKQWGGKLGAILVQKGFCSEDEVVSALTRHLGMPRVKLAEAKIDPRAQKCVTKQIAEKLHVFPYEISGAGRSEVVTIAMSDPTDLSAVDQLAFHTGKRIKPMLAGEGEVLSAIQLHYGGVEEKKEPTDKFGHAKAAAAPAAGAFPRRIEPQESGAPQPRPSPYIPPPIPAGRPGPPPQELEEIEPDEVMAGPADSAPARAVELPEDDGQDLGLEPIAAHVQGDAIAGQEEIAGEGSADDAVEGFVPATPGEGAVQAEGWESQPSAEAPAETPAEVGWESQPAAAAAEGWADASPAEGWAQPQETLPVEAQSDWAEVAAAGEAKPAAGGWGEELPADAILQAPEEQPAEEEPPAATEEAGATSEAAPVGAGDFDEPLPIEEDFESAPAEPPAAEESAPAQEMSTDDTPASEGQPLEDAAPEPTGAPWSEEPGVMEAPAGDETEALPPGEAEAPDAWAASEDPLAAPADDMPAWGDVPREGWADHATDDSATQEFANPSEAAQAAAESASAEAAAESAAIEAPPEWQGTSEEMAPAAEPSADEYAPAAPATESVGPEEAEAQLALAAEIAAAEAAQAESPQEEQPQFAEEQDATQLEGWVAPAEEPEPQGAGWMGEALEATAPLSRADLGALSSIGVDPNDGASALRLLAALVRVLNRHQLIDPEELAAEIRESRARGAGEVQEGENDLTAEPGAAATEPAET
ncbi:MAG TPA: hypothetical protein VFE90_21050 [Myxococcales bacterium]|nr:hypothetical protein [Myxococcales bacterium]